jgi:hypothetical protein
MCASDDILCGEQIGMKRLVIEVNRKEVDYEIWPLCSEYVCL